MKKVAKRIIYKWNKWLNDDSKSNKELNTMQKTSDITSKQVLIWAKRIEAQRSKKAVLTTIHESKDLDMVRQKSHQMRI